MYPRASIRNPTIWTTVKESELEIIQIVWSSVTSQSTICYVFWSHSQACRLGMRPETVGHFKDTMIRNTLLQVIISLILDFFGSEHVLFWQVFWHSHLLSPRNIASWRKIYPIPITTLYHATERKWLIWNWAMIAATPVGTKNNNPFKWYTAISRK